ncbi:hypothetical protein CG018_06480 [Gemella sp. ND 6198]|uniref:hypothetical protein n=1 Tax=Gemella sp. ND 6198 TaxID=2040624 RepID=UPI000E0BD836|nr:hypothetical protein [Gemella sp. ND 6198]AXI27069.1 hypothetical protein CG018_06480 [Gemella sp. ND 6198]
MRKMKKGIVAFTIAVMCLFIVTGCGKSGSDSKSSSGGTEQVETYRVDSSRISVLTNKGNAYYIGGGLAFSKETVDVDKPTKFLENIKDLVSGHAWIDKNNDLYIEGVDSINGGHLNEPKKLGGNIVSSTPYNLGVVAVDKDGNLYSFGKEKFNGFDKTYKEFTKIDDIKDVVKVSSSVFNYWFLALTKDGTVYNKKFDKKFEKVIDNAKDIQGSYIITKDDEVYHMGNELTKIGKSLKIGGYIDPGAVKFVEDKTIARVLWDGKKPRNDKETDVLYQQYPKDIKELIYHNISSDKNKDGKHILKMVYENMDGDIDLYNVYDCYNINGKTEKNISKVSKSVDDIAKIWDFVKVEKKN